LGGCFGCWFVVYVLKVGVACFWIVFGNECSKLFFWFFVHFLKSPLCQIWWQKIKKIHVNIE
jgi:hypothetical protein